MTSETFEQVLTAAQADGSFNPAWKKFVNTRFFVPVDPSNDNPAGKFALHTATHAAHPGPAVMISEVRERLGQQGTTIATLSGADVVRLLHTEAGILVALSDRAFSIARERVEWLKKGIEAAQARAAAKVQEEAAAKGAAPARPVAPPPAPAAGAAAPFPTLSAELATPPAAVPPAVARAPLGLAPVAAPAAPAVAQPAQRTPVQRNQSGVLDVAALKPRSISIADLGMDFFVPGDWKEARSARAVRFHDEINGTRVEITGMQRDDMTLHQWLAMRQNLVQHEMRHFTQDGEAYALDGEGWRDRVRGMAVEYAGTVPGEDSASRYLLACIRIDGTVVAIGIRASAAVFESQRALYKWLISRVDLVAPPMAEVRTFAGNGAAPAAAPFDDAAGTQDPPLFGMSTEGRIGRLRALAYSVPAVVPPVLAMALGAFLLPKSTAMGVALVLGGAITAIWFSVRLMIMRLHDLNLSGKWVLLLFGMSIMAVATRKPILLIVLALVFWIGTILLYYILPGNDGDNDYGPPPSENTTLIKVGAAIFCLFQLISMVGNVNVARSPNGMGNLKLGGGSIPGPNDAGIPFSPPDNSFVVELPDVPEEVELNGMPVNSNVEVLQYQLSDGNREYMVQAIDYGEVPDDRYAAMNQLERAVVAGDGVLVEAKPFMFTNGVIGREVRVNLRGNMVRAARFALVGSKLCVVIIAAPRGPEADAHIQAVFKTFQLQ